MKTILSISALVLILTGCGIKISSDTEGPAARAGLIGTWKSSCIGKSIMEFEFQTESSLVYYQTEYVTETCTGFISTSKSRLNYHLEGSEIVMGDDKAKPVRSQFSRSGNTLFLTMQGVTFTLNRQ